MERTRYTLAQRLLHWLIALMVLGSLAVGLVFMTLEYEGTVKRFGDEMTNTLYKYHKTFGVILLALMILRAALRWLYPPPPYRPPLPSFERIASRSVHLLFYALLLAMPVVGWLATAAGGYPVEFFDMKLPGLIGKDEALSQLLFQLHGIGGLLLLGLIALHIAGALRHAIRKDGVMQRMSLP